MVNMVKGVRGMKEDSQDKARYVDIQAHAGAYIIINVFLFIVWKLSKVQYR